MTGTVLILGSRGRFGRNMADAFAEAGWTVRGFDRGTDTLPEAAMGTDVIVNGWNPPYHRWAADLPGLTAQLVDAAAASGATILQPGNVYVFGAEAPELFGPDTPRLAKNPLGRLRIEMEAALRAAPVQVILLRAGDFLDTTASGNWFDRIMAKDVGKGRLVYPGDPDVPHAWAFLPDMARAGVALAEQRDRLGEFEEVDFPGYTLTGREMHALIEGVMKRPVRLSRMSWLPLHVARPFMPIAKGLLEMRYLWDKPHRMDPTRFEALLPGFDPTPPDLALRAALQDKIDPDSMVTKRAGTGTVAV